MARALFVCALLSAAVYGVLGQSDDDNSSDAPTTDYGIVIDAGSSHSAIYVYSWPHRESTTYDSTPPFSAPVTQEGWTSHNKNPISLFAPPNDPTQAGASLASLITFAKGVLANVPDQWSSTPIFLGATAGMRSLSIVNRNAIMASVRSYLADATKSPFAFQPNYARVLSGEEEGVFGWLTLNYAAGNLGPNAPSSAPAYLGALDMGGASTQITWTPGADILANFFNVRLPGANIDLYTHSYLHFGLNDATYRINDRVVNQTTILQPDGSYGHPCYNIGTKIVNYVTKDLPVPKTVNFTGLSQPTVCQAYAHELLHLTAPCWTPGQCGVSGEYQPPLTAGTKFIGFSAYASVFNSSNLGPATTLHDMELAQNTICSLTAAQLANQYGSPYASTLCIGLSYYAELLTNGYGFDSTGTANAAVFQALDSLNGFDLGWALGGMLYEANAMSWTLPVPDSGISRTAVVVVAVVLSILLIIVLLLLLVAYWKYQSLLQRVGGSSNAFIDH